MIVMYWRVYPKGRTYIYEVLTYSQGNLETNKCFIVNQLDTIRSQLFVYQCYVKISTSLFISEPKIEQFQLSLKHLQIICI